MTLFPDTQTAGVALPANRWWNRLHTDRAACVRLWCFPCIGAGTAIWRPWVHHLAGAAELTSICLPGRESRIHEGPLTRLDEIADALSAEMEPHAEERDVMCGYGMGGLLAFEVARRLLAAGARGPRALIVCGTPAPFHRWWGPLLHLLSPRDFMSSIERYFGPIPSEFRDRPEFLELLLPALRADLEAVETYQYQPGKPLDIPFLAITGDRDQLAPPATLSEWKRHTSSRFETAQCPGGHFIVTENPSGVAAPARRFLATL